MAELTKLQKQVQKEMERIKKFIERKEKEGFYFTKLPNLEFDKSKARRSQLERLKKLTPKKLLYERSEWVDPETGEIFEKKQGVAAEHIFRRESEVSYQEALQGTRYTDYEPINRNDVSPLDISVVERLREKIREIPDEIVTSRYKSDMSNYKGQLENMLDNLVDNSEDEESAIEYLNSVEEEINENVEVTKHYNADESISWSAVRIAVLLNHGTPLTASQARALTESYSEPQNDEVI